MKLDMEGDRTFVLVIAILLAGFFTAGFIVSTIVTEQPTGQMTGTPTDTIDQTDTSDQQEPAVSQEAALQKAKTFLLERYPPFVRNATTVHVNKDRRVSGTYMYNATIALTVEPNNWYDWATNETKTRMMNIYVSRNGDFIFSPPTSTSLPRPPAR